MLIIMDLISLEKEEDMNKNDTNLKNTVSDEEVVKLTELFYALKSKIWMIFASGLFCACLAAAYTLLVMVPTYTSTSSMLVLSKETTLTSIADLQLGTQLTNDYQVLITSTPVLEQVIENLSLDMTVETLQSNVTINNPSDTRIIEITVTDSDPTMAKNIVDEIAEVSSVYVGDKMEVIPPKIIEQGKIPKYRTSPSTEKNALYGLLAGILLCSGIIIVYVFLDDTIKSEDDITRYLGITTLASIPDRKDYINTRKHKNGQKQQH
jgi:capsular polysaccharide biosynthesis protein